MEIYKNNMLVFWLNWTAFAWLKCKEEIEDCGSFLRGYNIEGRKGKRFGADPKYVRMSMLSSDNVFEDFLNRLSAIQIFEQWQLYFYFIF